MAFFEDRFQFSNWLQIAQSADDSYVIFFLGAFQERVFQNRKKSHFRGEPLYLQSNIVKRQNVMGSRKKNESILSSNIFQSQNIFVAADFSDIF